MAVWRIQKCLLGAFCKRSASLALKAFVETSYERRISLWQSCCSSPTATATSCFASLSSKAVDCRNEIKVKKEYFDITFSKSSGPGGQNVNKVNSKVLLRFNINDANWLPDKIKYDLLIKEISRINKHGEMIISSDRYRTQQSNIEDALIKVQHIIDRVNAPIIEATPEKKEKIKLQIEREKNVRIQRKRIMSEKKKDRLDDF